MSQNRSRLKNSNVCHTIRVYRDGDTISFPNRPGMTDGEWSVVNISQEGASRGLYVTAWVDNETLTFRAQLPPGVDSTTGQLVVLRRCSLLSSSLPIVIATPFIYEPFDRDANLPFLRFAEANYENTGPNPRSISNAVCSGTPTPNIDGLSDFTWLWGQFIDHDIVLTPSAKPTEDFSVVAPADDPLLPFGIIAVRRSQFIVDESGVRQQVNSLSPFIDGGSVYGSDENRALALRKLDGSGQLKTSGDHLLPLNTDASLENEKLSSQDARDMFVAGDVRANENVLLLSMHTLFVREHNRWATVLLDENPQWNGDDERLYQEARRRVVALMQHITFNEFLPHVLGIIAPPRRLIKSESADARVVNEFSAATFRVGHTMVSDTVWLDRDGSSTLALRDAFFNVDEVRSNGIDHILEGAFSHVMQEIDTVLVEDMRNFLFGSPGSPPNMLHDLATINIQRGRDHGIALYNDLREAYGLERKVSFSEITDDVDLQNRLASVYESVDDIDAWIGALAEDRPDPSCKVGELIAASWVDQFNRLRAGDEFWYERSLPADILSEIRATKLSDIVRRNTEIENVPDDVFQAK